MKKLKLPSGRVISISVETSSSTTSDQETTETQGAEEESK